MALEIFKLVGSVFVDTDKANDSLQKVDKNAGKVAEGFSNAGKAVGAVGAAIGAAVVGAGTAIVGMANDTSEMADEIDKASIRMGIGAEKYQELAYAAGQCGVEMSTMEQAAKNLEGTDISFEDAIAQVMALGDEQERTAKALELFGERAAYNMAPLLAQSGEEFDALTQRAHDLGIVMSDEAVKAGVAYGDMSEDLKKASNAIETSIGAAVMPILTKLAEKLVEFMPTIQKLADRIGPLAAEFIDNLLPPLFDVAEQIMPELLSAAEELLPSLSEIAKEIIPVIVNLLKELLPVIVQVVNEVMPVLVDIIKMLTPILNMLMEFLSPILQMVLQLISPLLTLVMQILTPILNLVTALLGPFLELLTNILTPIFGIIEALLTPLTTLITAIMEPISDLLFVLMEPMTDLLNMILPPLLTMIQSFVEWASPALVTMFEWLGDFFTFIVDGLGTKGLTGAFQSFGDFFKNLWDGIVQVFKTAVNFVIKGINTLIEGLNGIEAPQWLQDLTGVSGVNLKTIPLLANGGDIESAGNVIVGERGPEMLSLPRGARVTPLDQTGIDYEKITECFINALRVMAPELATNINVNGNRDRIVDIVVQEANDRQKMFGRGFA
jgi:phage-related protein